MYCNNNYYSSCYGYGNYGCAYDYYGSGYGYNSCGYGYNSCGYGYNNCYCGCQQNWYCGYRYC